MNELWRQQADALMRERADADLAAIIPRPPTGDATPTGLYITCQGPIWTRLVRLDGLPHVAFRYRMAHTTGAPSVHVELDLLAEGGGVFEGGIGVKTEDAKTALEAFLGESLDAWFARERNFPPLRIVLGDPPGTSSVTLAGRVLPYIRDVAVWVESFRDQAAWVRWTGEVVAGGPAWTVEGHLVAL